MPCGCQDAIDDVRKYHEVRGFCKEPSNYDTGLAGIINSYNSFPNKGEYY